MLDDTSRALLEAGSGTLIGILDADGVPFATRGWGLTVLDGPPFRVRVLVGAGPLRSAGHEPGGTEPFAIAVTASDVRSLRSVQVKGKVVAIEEPTAEDLTRRDAYCDDFFGQVGEVDHIERSILERLMPGDLWACVCEIDEGFDQTPGPAAGARLAR